TFAFGSRSVDELLEWSPECHRLFEGFYTDAHLVAVLNPVVHIQAVNCGTNKPAEDRAALSRLAIHLSRLRERRSWDASRELHGIHSGSRPLRSLASARRPAVVKDLRRREVALGLSGIGTCQSSGDDGDPTGLARAGLSANHDLHIPVERRQQVHQALDREACELVVTKRRHFR